MLWYCPSARFSLATVTPSVGTWGCRTSCDDDVAALRTSSPHGRGHVVTPLSSALLASSSNLSCSAWMTIPLTREWARMSSSRMMRIPCRDLDSEPEYFPNRILSPAFTSSGTSCRRRDLAVRRRGPCPPGAFLGRVRMMIPPVCLLLSRRSTRSIVQRTNLHLPGLGGDWTCVAL